MRTLLLTALLLGSTFPAFAQAGVSGRVVDHHGRSVPGATVRVEGTGTGVVADADGAYRLSLVAGRYVLAVTAVGYRAGRVDVVAPASGVVVRLHEEAPDLGEVVVMAQARVPGDPAAPPERTLSTEDLFARVGGMQAIARGGFAWEPQIRGLGLGPVSLTLDGMKVYGACVDRMDPASSYVEPENLARMDVHKGPSDLGHGTQTGGSVDLVSEDPVFGRPGGRLDAGIETPTGLRRLSFVAGASAGRLAVRASGVYRQAAAYVPGGGRAALAYSGYTKRNARLAATLRLGAHTTLTAQGLADDAWNVGYPVLLMDATLAQARIGSLRLRRDGPVRFDVTAYANRVDHTMDDRHRDVLERPVMRGMYMPMAGYTATAGVLAEAAAERGAWRLGGTLDGHRVRQFGDMWMYSLYPGIADMYLLNVGDAEAYNGAVSARAGRRLGRLDAELQLRLDGTRRDVRDPRARALLRGRDASLDTTARAFVVPSASLRMGYAAARGLHLHLSASDAGRLPTLVEHYGHYVYNYADGYFYTGSPALGAERTRGLEVGADLTGDGYTLRLAAFSSSFRHHIGGEPDPTVTGGTSYQFRTYTDAGRASLYGGEASVLLMPGRGVSLGAQAAYVKAKYPAGHSHGSSSHFPGLPPLHGRLALRLDRRIGYAEIETRWAAAQTAVPTGSPEVPTPAFAVLNVHAGVRLSRFADLRTTLENAFDTYYREHQSVGRLPGRGRALFVGLSTRW